MNFALLFTVWGSLVYNLSAACLFVTKGAHDVKAPIRVAVTGGAGQIGYSLLFRLASGEVFGPDQPVILQVLEIPPAMNALRGVVMELQDCAYPLLHDVVATDDMHTAFRDAN